MLGNRPTESTARTLCTPVPGWGRQWCVALTLSSSYLKTRMTQPASISACAKGIQGLQLLEFKIIMVYF